MTLLPVQAYRFCGRHGPIHIGLIMRNFVSMTTVTHGEIIDLNVRIENPGRPGDKRIVFFMFLQFFYFWDTHI